MKKLMMLVAVLGLAACDDPAPSSAQTGNQDTELKGQPCSHDGSKCEQR